MPVGLENESVRGSFRFRTSARCQDGCFFGSGYEPPATITLLSTSGLQAAFLALERADFFRVL